METKIDKSTLQELVEQRLSQREIAKRLNCCYRTVKKWLKIYGLKTLFYEEIDKSVLQELVSQRLTQDEIATRLNCSQGTVRNWLKKYGLKTLFYELYECKECGETDVDKFRPRMRYKCRRCSNIDDAVRFRKRKQDFVDYKGGKCEVCGYNKCLGSLDFHHHDPEKKDPDWRKMKNLELEAVKGELDKCALLCKNCHGEIHYDELYKRR